MRHIGIRSVHYYIIIGGVLLGLSTPATPWFSYRQFADTGGELLRELNQHLEHGDENRADALLGRLEKLVHETEAPLERLDRLLAPWVSFIVLPLFALTNAGVAFSMEALKAATASPIVHGIAAGLLLGKFAGISTLSWIAVRFEFASLPNGVDWRHMTGVALLGGIGFTVSLFITSLAFQGESNDQAKIGILLISFMAGLGGYAFLRVRATARQPNGGL